MRFLLLLPWIFCGVAHALPTETELKKMHARFTPVDLSVDTDVLPQNEQAALVKLIEAAKIMDALFLRQVWAGNESLLLDLLADTSSLGKTRLSYFLINKGPWSRLDDNQPFLPCIGDKPGEANYYSSEAAKFEVEAWFKTLSGREREIATGFFSTIRRDAGAKFHYQWYSDEYHNELSLAAQRLREAGRLTQNASLATFLNKRAAAFLSNDYYESDVAWMQLDAAIEPTIGPYEVYEDEWFNAKAAFEAFITLRDDAETKKLAGLAGHLQDIENNLPIAPGYKNPKLGALAPIRVVNSLFSSGDANRGVQTAAFNLPNDERVTRDYGAKRVMLKNVQEAKFKNVLIPISKIVLAKAEQKFVAFDPFFTHILMHELMHGLGPHTLAQKNSTVRAELQELYSAIEECKADISGLWALQYLIDKNLIEKSGEASIYTTYLASMFRSIRFGINEAHGKGTALQLNYMLDAGAVSSDKNGFFHVDVEKMKAAVTQLTTELMTLQAEGNKTRAQELLTRLAILRPEVKQALERLKAVPVDINPRFVSAQKLLAKFATAP